MAFSTPIEQDLLSAIRDHTIPPCFPMYIEANLVRRCTMGLSQLFTEISAAAAFGGTVAKSSNFHSDERGHLNIGTSNPTLAKRYRLQEIVGEGTFSQIFSAIDIYTGKTVAIKVMKARFGILGAREVAFLRYFNSKEMRGPQHFLKVHGAFGFENHFCIVLDLYDTTLLSMVSLPKIDTSCDDMAQNIGQTGFLKIIHQPRVLRKKISSNNKSNLNSTTHDKHINNNDDTANLRVLDLKKVSRIARNLTMALCMLHKDGAIHADIKPENCFIRLIKSPSNQIKNINGNNSKNDKYQNSNNNDNKISNHYDDKNNNSTSSSRKSISPHEKISSLSILLSETTKDLSNDLLDDFDFDLQLGDFGNSIHISDVEEYLSDYDIQTLAYRSPEVLLGIPFDYQIDLWSLGILLIEICIGKPLFIVRSRQELYNSICEKLTVPPRVRFAGGVFSELLTGSEVSKLEIPDWGLDPSISTFNLNSTPTLNSKINFAEHLLNIKKLLDNSISNSTIELIHFLAGLLHPDPDYRLTAIDAHNHPFLANGLNVPLSMTWFQTNRQSRVGAAAVGLKVLRSISVKCENIRNASNIKINSPAIISNETTSRTKKPIVISRSDTYTILDQKGNLISNNTAQSDNNLIMKENGRSSCVHNCPTRVLSNESKDNKFDGTELILKQIKNPILSPPLNGYSDIRQDYTSNLKNVKIDRDGFSARRGQVIEKESEIDRDLENSSSFPSNELEMNIIIQNDRKYVSDRNVRARDEFENIGGEVDEVVEEEEEEGDGEEEEWEDTEEEDEEEEVEEAELIFDGYVSSKPKSSLLPSNSISSSSFVPAISTKFQSSNLPNISLSTLMTKEIQHCHHSSETLSTSREVDKKKLPVEVQRMKNHDFLLTMKNPVRNISDDKIDPNCKTNVNIVDSKRKSKQFNDIVLLKKKKYDVDLT